MKYRFIKMLNSYLADCGRTDVINNDIDIHSTISLKFNNAQQINIDLLNDEIILWTDFGKYSEIDIKQLSFDLFQFVITNPSSLYQRGQPILHVDNDNLILSVVLIENILQDEAIFKQSIEYFYERVCILHDIITG